MCTAVASLRSRQQVTDLVALGNEAALRFTSVAVLCSCWIKVLKDICTSDNGAPANSKSVPGVWMVTHVPDAATCASCAHMCCVFCTLLCCKPALAHGAGVTYAARAARHALFSLHAASIRRLEGDGVSSRNDMSMSHCVRQRVFLFKLAMTNRTLDSAGSQNTCKSPNCAETLRVKHCATDPCSKFTPSLKRASVLQLCVGTTPQSCAF